MDTCYVTTTNIKPEKTAAAKFSDKETARSPYVMCPGLLQDSDCLNDGEI